MAGTLIGIFQDAVSTYRKPAQFMRKGSKQGLDAAIRRWLQDHSADVKRFKEMVEEMKLRGPVDIAKLSVAAKTLRDLIAY